MMTKHAVIINGNEFAVKEFNGKRVVTFKEIAELHQIKTKKLQDNFRNNRRHFIESIDYFQLRGKKDIRNFRVSSKLAVRINVFTESGYLMLVKSLTDDLSWQVQRELVNSYFKAVEIQPAQLNQPFDPEMVRELMLGYLEFKTGRSDKWFKKLVYYRQLGLTQKETGKLLDCDPKIIRQYERMLKLASINVPFSKFGQGRFKLLED